MDETLLIILFWIMVILLGYTIGTLLIFLYWFIKELGLTKYNKKQD